MPKTWMGPIPEHCQICDRELKTMFIDGRIKSTGQWCLMCAECHTAKGAGLGIGCGKAYNMDGTSMEKQLPREPQPLDEKMEQCLFDDTVTCDNCGDEMEPDAEECYSCETPNPLFMFM